MSMPNLKVTRIKLPGNRAVQVDTMNGRGDIAINNGDGQTIWMGSDSSVTNVTGFPIAAGATFGPFRVGFDVPTGGGAIWLFSIAGTGALSPIALIEAAGPK